MADMVTLVVPAGTDGYPVSHGDQEFPMYRPDGSSPWLVDVPREAATYFLSNGGFSMARSKTQQQDDLPVGMVRLLCPTGVDACNFSGREYVADDDGAVLVPQDATGQLCEAFGFKIAPTSDTPPPTKEERAAELMKELAELGVQVSVDAPQASPQTKDGGSIERIFPASQDAEAHPEAPVAG